MFVTRKQAEIITLAHVRIALARRDYDSLAKLIPYVLYILILTCRVLAKSQSNPHESTNPIVLFAVVTSVMGRDNAPHAVIDRFCRQLFSISPNSYRIQLMCEVCISSSLSIF